MAKYVFILVGIGMFFFAFFMHCIMDAKINIGIKTEGTVIDIQRTPQEFMGRGRRTGDGYRYYPVIQFTTQNNETIEFVALLHKGPSFYSKGQKIEVIYNPSSPEDAIVNDFFALWGFTILASLFGAIPLFKGLILARNGH